MALITVNFMIIMYTDPSRVSIPEVCVITVPLLSKTSFCKLIPNENAVIQEKNTNKGVNIERVVQTTISLGQSELGFR